MPGSPPPLGLVVSKNLRTPLETVDDTADAPAPASKENAASSTAAGKRIRMSKNGRSITPYGGSPDENGSDDDAQLKAPAATANDTGRKANTKGKATGKAKGKAKVKAEGNAKSGAGRVRIRPIGRDLSIGPPFRLKYKTWRQNFRLDLFGRVGERYILQITGISRNTSLNFRTIMKTILEEVKAGALTTKGQVIDRRSELVEIERAEAWALAEATARGESSSGGTASTAEHRAAGEFFGADVESRHPLDCNT